MMEAITGTEDGDAADPCVQLNTVVYHDAGGYPTRPLHEHSPHLLNDDNDHGKNDTKDNDNGKVRLKQSLRHRDGKFLGCAVTMGGLPAHSLARSHDLTCQA